MSALELRLLRWLQRRCKHDPSKSIADILQRDNLPTVVTWCAACGAVAVREDDKPIVYRRPEPTW